MCIVYNAKVVFFIMKSILQEGSSVAKAVEKALKIAESIVSKKRKRDDDSDNEPHAHKRVK